MQGCGPCMACGCVSECWGGGGSPRGEWGGVGVRQGVTVGGASCVARFFLRTRAQRPRTETFHVFCQGGACTSFKTSGASSRGIGTRIVGTARGRRSPSTDAIRCVGCSLLPPGPPRPVVTSKRFTPACGDGCRVQGSFVRGNRSGAGVMYFANGDVFTGSFACKRFHSKMSMLKGAPAHPSPPPPPHPPCSVGMRAA